MKSSSHLNRAVFQALIANRPYVSRECLKRAIPSAVTRPRPQPRPKWQRGVNQHQQRHFLEALLGTNKPPRSLQGERPTAKNLDVAIGKLVDLLRATRSRSRPPPHEELADALRFLFSSRFDQKQPMTRNEVFLATETYKYLDARDWVLTGQPGALAEGDVLIILETLAFPSPKERFRGDLRALAELVVNALARVPGSVSKESEEAYLTILARSGSALEARDQALSQRWPPDEALILEIMRGLIVEAKYSDFWKLLDQWKGEAGGIDQLMHEQLVTTLIQADRIFDAQRMYDQPVLPPGRPTTKCLTQMLEFLISSGKLNFAGELAQILTTRMRDDDVLGSLILWHAARDPRLDHLSSLVHGLLQNSHTELSMNTFNNVIEYALSQNNPSLAQAVQQLAIQEGLTPDGKTYALQLQYTIDANHSDRASRMYEAMLKEDIPKDDFDLKILNKYLAYLAFQPNPPHELILRVADNLLERDAHFDVEAVAGLCHIFLQRGEVDEAFTLLRHRIDFYPLADRARINIVFRNFIVDPTITAQRAFNAYELFRTAFPDTSCALRLPIMQSFFDRKRPDLACLVFSHMRQADPQDAARPDASAYTKCFEGIAQCRDVDGLQSIYNMLKLDLQVEISTQIRNGLMLANIACQTPWQAIIDHFYKIMDSREGPTYSTFEVALRACETWPPYGAFEARKIIAIMQSWNLEITKDVYDNYVGAIAGQCEFENAVDLIENMVNDLGESPDAFTIGTFYNAIPWQFRKDEVEKWAKQAYPDLWDELLTFGEEIDEEWEMRFFKLDRSIEIDDPLLFAAGEWRPELQRQVQSQIEPLPMVT